MEKAGNVDFRKDCPSTGDVDKLRCFSTCEKAFDFSTLEFSLSTANCGEPAYFLELMFVVSSLMISAKEESLRICFSTFSMECFTVA